MTNGLGVLGLNAERNNYYWDGKKLRHRPSAISEGVEIVIRRFLSPGLLDSSISSSPVEGEVERFIAALNEIYPTAIKFPFRVKSATNIFSTALQDVTPEFVRKEKAFRSRYGSILGRISEGVLEGNIIFGPDNDAILILGSRRVGKTKVAVRLLDDPRFKFGDNHNVRLLNVDGELFAGPYSDPEAQLEVYIYYQEKPHEYKREIVSIQPDRVMAGLAKVRTIILLAYYVTDDRMPADPLLILKRNPYLLAYYREHLSANLIESKVRAGELNFFLVSLPNQVFGIETYNDVARQLAGRIFGEVSSSPILSEALAVAGEFFIEHPVLAWGVVYPVGLMSLIVILVITAEVWGRISAYWVVKEDYRRIMIAQRNRVHDLQDIADLLPSARPGTVFTLDTGITNKALAEFLTVLSKVSDFEVALQVIRSRFKTYRVIIRGQENVVDPLPRLKKLLLVHTHPHRVGFSLPSDRDHRALPSIVADLLLTTGYLLRYDRIKTFQESALVIDSTTVEHL